jgi:uncharacterized sulfatase
MAGTVISETVANLDWYPTIVEMAGLKVPAGATIRGRSIVPLLKGDQPAWDNDFYGEYSTRHQSHTHMRMYRTSEWKLIRDFLDPSRDELYNLKDDPEETKNLIAVQTAEVKMVIADLHARIVARMRGIGDPVVRMANGPLPGQ